MAKIPKYRKHSSRDIAFYAHKGKRHYLPGRYNSPESRAAFEKFKAEAFPDPASPRIISASVSVRELVTHFLIWAKGYYGEGRTEYGNMTAALVPLIKFCGVESAAAFGPKRLKEFRETLVKTLARGTINSYIRRVKQCFGWGVSEEIIPPSVLYGLKAVPGLKAGRTEARETVKRQPVPWEHVEPVLKELAGNETVTAMVWLQWLTGARSSSICKARPEQFTRDGDLLLWRPRHKTEAQGKEVILPIGPKCQAILEPFLHGPADEPMFNPRRRRKNRRYGTHYTAATYYRAVARALNRANKHLPQDAQIPAWSPHQVRHSKGHSVRSQYGLEAVQATLGHATVDASQLYSEPRLELAKRVARDLG